VRNPPAISPSPVSLSLGAFPPCNPLLSDTPIIDDKPPRLCCRCSPRSKSSLGRRWLLRSPSGCATRHPPSAERSRQPQASTRPRHHGLNTVWKLPCALLCAVPPRPSLHGHLSTAISPRPYLHGRVSMRMQWGRHLYMTCVLTLCAELLPRLDAPGLQCTAPRDSIDLNLENHC
jgi:hypothetical protein